MKHKIDFKYRSFGIRILVSVILISSVCLLLTAFFTGRNYLREQENCVALEAQLLTEKTLREWTGLRVRMSDYEHLHKKMFFHPDSVKIICESIAGMDSTLRFVRVEYVPENDTLSYYNRDSLFKSYGSGTRDMFVTSVDFDDKYIRLSHPIYDDNGVCSCVINFFYSPDILMPGQDSSSLFDRSNSMILVDSQGNYLKKTGRDISYSLDGSINYLDSIRVLWGEESYSDLMRAMREKNFQTIREVDNKSAFMCITSRNRPFEAMIWKVDIDSAPFNHLLIRNAVLFLTSLLLLCLIGYINMRRLAKLVRSEEKYETEIKDAAMIQMEMLPSNSLNSPSIDLDAVLIPSAGVGGDCYYYYEKDGLLYFCIGDVVGKGLSAALFMSKVVSLFHNISQYHSDADTIAESMNRELCTGNDDLMFVTMFIAILDVRTRILKYCNAGHESPVFWSGEESDRPFIMDTCHDTALGIEPDVSFTQSVMHIAPGAMMCIYTDGVTEAKNDSLTMFGSANLLDAFGAACRGDAKSLNSAIVSAVKDFALRHPQSDDITILTIKVKPVKYSVTLENTEKETEKLRDMFAYLRNSLFCTDAQLMDIRVAVDEAVTNCINYAYGTGKGLITVQVSSESGGIVFIIKDEGIPFNLLEYDIPERSDMTVEDVELGGLGIPLIKRTFDNIEYRRDGDSNILKLTINSI